VNERVMVATHGHQIVPRFTKNIGIGFVVNVVRAPMTLETAVYFVFATVVCPVHNGVALARPSGRLKIFGVILASHVHGTW
jgi:hypothetical protein